MKIGVFAVLFGDKPFEETLDHLVSLGVQAVEVGTGAFPGDAHCRPADLLEDVGRLKAFRRAVESRGLVISALSCHGNPLHPDRRIAKGHHETFIDTVALAKKLGVSTVVTFSGCPGADAKAVLDDYALMETGIEEVCARLEEEGVKSFLDSHRKLLAAVEGRLNIASAG